MLITTFTYTSLHPSYHLLPTSPSLSTPAYTQLACTCTEASSLPCTPRTATQHRVLLPLSTSPAQPQPCARQPAPLRRTPRRARLARAHTTLPPRKSRWHRRCSSNPARHPQATAARRVSSHNTTIAPQLIVPCHSLPRHYCELPVPPADHHPRPLPRL
jgi:hypothetical protein